MRHRLGRTTIVGISGIDCAGKTTLAARLAAGLPEAVVVEGDDFNRPRSERSTFPAEDPDYGFAYEALARRLLAPAREGTRAEARLRVKDWERDVWTERDFVIEPGATAIVEGVFLFRPSLRPLFDLAIWIDITFENALERAMRRDAGVMGGPDGVRERYETRYFPAQRLHLEGDRPRELADLVLVSTGE
jgi:uridine kinase